jgi:hypothetical protein
MVDSVGERTIDRYLASGFATVRGMSSHFAATICAYLVQRQTDLGISGGIEPAIPITPAATAPWRRR